MTERDARADPVAERVRALGLEPHPEGGWYKEIWRSAARVAPGDGRAARAALTTIYYLLPQGAVSRWHRVRSDEVWHYCEGAPLELVQVAPDELRASRLRLGPLAPGQAPLHGVPAGFWQAARSTGAYTLAGCTVGPGFEFADFELLADRPDRADALCRAIPDAARFL
jgi:predicted cupin superfamily sugar epimerase